MNHVEGYMDSSSYKRRPSYLPEKDSKFKNINNAAKMHAGSTYFLDPFTGNIIDGNEDNPIPEHILLQHLNRTSMHENTENASSGLNLRPSRRNTSSRRQKKIEDFYGNLEDINSRMTVSWKDITYSVPDPKNKKEKKQILYGLDGQARPGETVGIIGSSGAGKTTLLNILAGRVSTGDIGGTMLVNGQKRGPLWRRVIGYVEQEDLMYRTLTVRETLSYAALLRLPLYLTRKQKLERVNEIIHQLGLEKCQNSLIGDEFSRGISGGERKRVSIGVELVANPRMLFMDEPTTGLDSYTSFQLIQNVSNLAVEQARTVVMTIHQPREDILFLFDKILLMSQGKMIFFGPTQSALDHMESLGYPCPMYQNPANFFIDMISVDFKKQNESDSVEGTNKESVDEISLEDPSQKRVTFLINAWEEKKVAELKRRGLYTSNSIAKSHHPATTPATTDGPMAALTVDHSANNLWLAEVWILLSRYMIDSSRNMLLFSATIGQQIAMIILIGFTFFQLPLTQEGIQSRIGVLFLTVINNIIMILQPIVLTFPLEKPIIKKERWSSCYRNSSLYIAKVMSTFPLRLAVTLLYGLSSYYIIGLNPAADRFFIFQIILIDLVFNSQAIGLAVSASVSTVEAGQVFGPLIFLVLLIYAGNFAGTTIPAVLAWIKYIASARYAYMSFSQNEFNGLTFLCSDGQPPVNDVCQGGGYATGEQVLEAFDLNQFPIYTNCLILLGMTFGFHIIALIALYITTKPKSKIV
jgi:ABC-type multidrug transport system ATPase subunit